MGKVTRRDFVKSAAAIGGFSVLPSGLWVNPPNSKLTFALAGCGGNGRGNLSAMIHHPSLEVVAICDPDKNQMATAMEKLAKDHPNKKFNLEMYQDHREMLSKLGDKLDSIFVSTPDHNHHPVTLEAMNLGKHVYTQKPLTNKIRHARELREVANKTGVVNRMGIQLHSDIGNRTVVHYIRDGAIGRIKTVYVWSNKSWGSDSKTLPNLEGVPESFNWPVWLGNAPEQPYRKGFHPSHWRRYLDFGAATLGDMGVHIFDTPFKALDLTYPKWVKTTCREPNGFSHPAANMVEYSFEETKYTTDGFLWTWFDGDKAQLKVPKLELLQGKELPSQGAIYVGEKGIILHPHGGGPIFYPEAIGKGLKKPDLPAMHHTFDWIDACIAGKPSPWADFNYAAMLTETVLLGVIGNRFPGQKLEWDAKAMKFPNMPEADKWI